VVPTKYRVAACTSLPRALLIIAVALLLAALAAPWVYRVVQHIPLLSEHPFRRVFNRVVVVGVVAGMVLCWRWLGVRFRPRILFRRKRALPRYAVWFGIGFVCISALVLAQVYAGLQLYRYPTVAVVLRGAALGLLSAVCVGIIEELAFRGFLLQVLLSRVARYRAILVSSAIFACLHLFSLDHFLKPIRHVELDGTHWDAGLRLLVLFFKPLAQPQVVVPGLVGLFLAGWLLAELTVRTRTLWAAMGLHTGWVFAIKALGRVWKYHVPLPDNPVPVWWYGEKYAATGVLGWLIVALLIVCVNGMALYGVYRLAEWIVRGVPRARLMACGRALGRLACRCARRQRRIAFANVSAAFPEKPAHACHAIVRQSFETLGMLAIEVLDFPRVARQFFTYVQPEGLEHIAAAHAAGQAVVFFTGHFGSWEIFPIGCGLLGYPFTGVARPFQNEWIYARVLKLRCASGVRILDKREITHDVLACLHRKEMVGFVGDQYAGARGLPTLFFGRPASTSPAMATFARKTGAVLIAAFDHLMPDGSHRPVIYPAFSVARSSDSARDIFDATQRLMAMLEAEIRRDPGMWLWMHRKWRTPKSQPVQSV